MPQADDDVTILVCDCGKRLRAPGARPGRVGKCPSCGGTLRFPDEARPEAVQEIASDPPPRPRRPKPKPPSAAPIRVGALAPSEPDESVLPERAQKLDPERREDLLDAARQVGRGGILRLPRKSRFGLRDALLYPIWDFAALSWIGFLPFMLGLPFLAVFYLIPVVMRGGEMALFGPFAFPMIVVFGFGLGYLGQIFTEVLAASAAGEVHHPKWPEIEFGALVASLFRWACGLAIGLGLASIPASRYWRATEEHGLADKLAVAAIVASGLAYGLMSLASLSLHGELLAANPLMVLMGIFKAGWRYWQTVALAVGFAVAGTAAIQMIDRFSGSFLILPATWLAWALIVYGGVVVSRSLGMVCHARRQQIGWFPDRERWGASMDDIDPSLFRDKEGRKAL